MGFVAAAVSAAGVMAFGAVAAVCGLSIVGEAVTGKNPVRDVVGQSNFDDITLLSTGGSLLGYFAAVQSGIKPTYPKPSSGAGTAPGTGTTQKGWKLGGPIDNLIRQGNEPSWTTVRQRFWKNEAFYNPNDYTPANLARMQRGLAPQQFNLFTGGWESMELHHIIPQSTGLPNIHAQSNLLQVWPSEHSAIDKFRYLGGGR